MDTKYQGKYRIPSARLAGWDYRNAAAYFVTICTANREMFFGDIKDGVMHLSEAGNVAYECWVDIPNHFPFVRLDAHVVMPNHIHGIVVIGDHTAPVVVGALGDGVVDGTLGDGVVGTLDCGVVGTLGGGVVGTLDCGVVGTLGDGVVETLHCNVSTDPTDQPDQPIQPNPTDQPIQPHQPHQPDQPINPGEKNEFMASISPKPGSLSTIIRSYKSAVTKLVHPTISYFQWQSRFHDHIIRNDDEYQRIAQYIENNPAVWHEDKFYNRRDVALQRLYDCKSNRQQSK